MSEPSLRPPVAWIIFNRANYAREVFAAIRAARPERLYVIADGPRADRPDDHQTCAAARALVDGVDWPCQVRRDFAETNLGSGRRIASGLAWVFAEETEAIVLEDDFVPHPDFFRYCAELLERYRDDPRVATIGGANFLAHLQDFPAEESYFFSRYYSIAGWASWRRAWKNFDYEMRGWPEFKRRGLLQQIYADPYVRHYFDYAWEQCAQGQRPDVWDFHWMFACASNHGLCAVPRVNLTQHIGVVGTHSAQLSPNDHLPIASLYDGAPALRHPRFMLPNPAYDVPFFERNFHPASIRTPWGRTKRRLRGAWEVLQGRPVR
jgi:hypothetical protein